MTITGEMKLPQYYGEYTGKFIIHRVNTAAEQTGAETTWSFS